MADKEKYLQYGRLQINLLSRIVYIDNQESVLTRMEFDVLYFLASNPDIAFTKEQIYEAVSTDGYSGGTYIIRDIIYRLRTKLKITNVRTLHGYGYKFSSDNEGWLQRNLGMCGYPHGSRTRIGRYIYCGTRRASTSVTFMWRKNRGGSLSALCTAHWWTTSCGKATCW